MIFIGIDPGKKGALAAIFIEPQAGVNILSKIRIIPFDEYQYRQFFRSVPCCECFCALERVNAMPGQGVKSMFSFGENYGFIRGLLQAFNVSYETVPPQKWKKEFSLGRDKKASIKTAKRLYPEVSLRPTERCKVDNDGMAEALLLAEYARRKA